MNIAFGLAVMTRDVTAFKTAIKYVAVGRLAVMILHDLCQGLLQADSARMLIGGTKIKVRQFTLEEARHLRGDRMRIPQNGDAMLSAQPCQLALQLLVAGYAINASSVVSSNVAIGIGEARMPAIFATLGGVVTIVALAILAPRFGATGAALAAAIGMSQALIFNHLLARRLGEPARPASWPLILRLLSIALPVGLLTAAVSSIVQGWLTLLALGGAASLLFLGIWLASFGRSEERMLLDDLVRRARRNRNA